MPTTTSARAIHNPAAAVSRKASEFGRGARGAAPAGRFNTVRPMLRMPKPSPGCRPLARPPHPSTSSVHMSVSEGEVSGLVACDNEGCAGWTGAEPHAWETAHEPGYALCRTGYRQEAHRRCGGRGAAGWRG